MRSCCRSWGIGKRKNKKEERRKIRRSLLCSRYQMKKKNQQLFAAGFLLAEKVGFEPTDGFTRQTISSRSRYDHFDTSPYYRSKQSLLRNC